MYNSGIMKILAISAVICFAECAAGSCLNYGHACWGAHGKRSGARTTDQEKILEPSWFLSKLINNPSDIRYVFEGNEIKDKTDLFRRLEEEKPRLDDWTQSSDDLFDDYNGKIAEPNNKVRYNILEKRSANHN